MDYYYIQDIQIQTLWGINEINQYLDIELSMESDYLEQMRACY